jgi:AcrR family transcriptional regulator
MPRRYTQRRRAEQQEETRRRIAAATVALHQEVGMLRTTIKDIAVRSGVERATVYRHFPDERALLHACTAHYNDEHPLPDPTPWLEEPDPVTRLHIGLTGTYAYHRLTESMMTRILPEIPDVPAAQEVARPMMQHWQHVRDVLATGWGGDDGHQRILLALIGHAIGFWTWKSLVREQGLDDDQAVEAMVTMVRGHADIVWGCEPGSKVPDVS